MTDGFLDHIHCTRVYHLTSHSFPDARAQNRQNNLRAQRAQLSEQIKAMEIQIEDATRQVVAVQDKLQLLKAQSNDLMRDAEAIKMVKSTDWQLKSLPRLVFSLCFLFPTRDIHHLLALY